MSSHHWVSKYDLRTAYSTVQRSTTALVSQWRPVASWLCSTCQFHHQHLSTQTRRPSSGRVSTISIFVLWLHLQSLRHAPAAPTHSFLIQSSHYWKVKLLQEFSLLLKWKNLNNTALETSPDYPAKKMCFQGKLDYFSFCPQFLLSSECIFPIGENSEGQSHFCISVGILLRCQMPSHKADRRSSPPNESLLRCHQGFQTSVQGDSYLAGLVFQGRRGGALYWWSGLK